MNEVPSIDELGAWALSHFFDCPEITIGTNTELRTFYAADKRDGPPMGYPFAYLYELQKRILARDAALVALAEQRNIETIESAS